MWLGGDRWVYQKVGRTDRQYLLKRPLTTVELQALSVATTPPPAAQASYSPPLEVSYAPSEPEEIAPISTPAPPPPATISSTAERPKGLPRTLVVTVAIIALLFIVAAVIIIATQL